MFFISYKPLPERSEVQRGTSDIWPFFFITLNLLYDKLPNIWVKIYLIKNMLTFTWLFFFFFSRNKCTFVLLGCSFFWGFWWTTLNWFKTHMCLLRSKKEVTKKDQLKIIIVPSKWFSSCYLRLIKESYIMLLYMSITKKKTQEPRLY